MKPVLKRYRQAGTIRLPAIERPGGFALFCVVLFCFLGICGYFSTQLLREENQIKTHRHLMELLSEQIENIVTQHFKTVQALSRDRAILDLLEGRGHSPGPGLTHVLETARLISEADRIYALDHNGIIVSSTRGSGHSIIGDNYAFRPYFKDAWKGRTTVFPAFDDRSGRMELHLSTPIYGASNESIDGVLALEFDISVVEDLLYQRAERIGLLSPDGIIFTSNYPGWMFHSIRPLAKNRLENLRKIKQFSGKKILPLNLDLNRKIVRIEEENYYTALVPMPISGWKLVSFQKKDTRPALPLYYKLLVGTGLFVTGGLAMLVFFLLINIQKQKKTQSELFRTQEKYSSIFRNAVMGIYQSTIDGHFIEVNPSMAKILGFDTPAELVKKIKRIDYQVYVHSDDRRTFLRNVLKNNRISGFETQFLKKNGEKIWVQLSGRLAHAPGNDPPFLEGFCIDITEKKNSQKRSAMRQQQLLAADRMISMGVLASGVAHEINNPNTFIHSNAQFLSDAWNQVQIILDDYYEKNGDFIISGLPYSRLKEKFPVVSIRILEGSRRIARIIKELRNYSRNDESVTHGPVDVNKVVQSALVLLENMIKKSTQRFKLELNEGLPLALGNFQRLEQVIVNIVQNACQAIEDDKQALSVSSFYSRSNDRIVIICRDEGIGIPADNLKRILDPFFTTKRDSGGTGLGLSISSTIIQELDGDLDIQSETGKGTVVRVELPPANIKDGKKTV